MDTPLRVRIQPHSEEAEQCVLGAMLLDKEAVSAAAGILRAEEFFNENNKLIYTAILDMYTYGYNVDISTLTSNLESKGIMDKIGGKDYLVSLITNVPGTSNIDNYARLVKEKATLRGLITGMDKIVSDCYEDVKPLSDIVENAEKLVYDVSMQKSSGEFTSLKQAVKPALLEIAEKFESNAGLTGVPTGFTDIDAITNGFQKSDFIILAARPSMGKTALGLNIATNAVLRYGKSVAFFSLEMSTAQLVTRIISSESEVNQKKLRDGKNLSGDWKKILNFNTIVDEGDAKLFIDDTSGISVGDIRSKLRKLAVKEGLDMVVIDYLGLLTTNAVSKNENRQNYVAQISRELKALAKEMNIPVLTLSQLNRSTEERGAKEKKPVLSDLRDSGAIEQDADLVLMIYRNSYYDKEADSTDAEIIIAKHRNGETGSVKVTFLPPFTKFVDYIPPVGGDKGDEPKEENK